MEFYINMPNVPKKGDYDYDAFFKRELEKIRYGLTIDGVFIHGWLYWHLNHWKIMQDIIDPNSSEIIRKFTNPQLRDNEWLIATHLREAEEQKTGLCIVGTRRFSKSVFEASFIGRSATIFEGSENVIVGNNKDDLGVITSLCDKGLNALHEYFRFGRIADDWKKEVSLGFKDKKGRRDEWSKIFIRNTDGGTETEVVAGTTPKALILDEAGKAKFLEVFAAAVPAFASPFGWRAVPIIVGTGGDMENGKDLEKMFNDPDTYNMLSTTLEGEGGKKACIFVPGTYALEFPKIKTTLGAYLNVENKDSELYQIDFYYSDHEANKQIILKRREELAKAKDAKELLKYKMYYPLTSDECFLTETGNNFPVEAARASLELIMRKPELQGTPTRLYRDYDNKVVAERDNKRKFIWDYPHTPGSDLNAPIMIWEPPVKNPPLYLYIAGIDPYNQNVSQTSESLGTCYIYKRMYDPVAGTFQNRIVASYSARPQTMKEWQENVELLLEYYNAVAMMENEGTTLLQYLDSKNKGHLLADGFSLLTEISPNTTIKNRPKGLPATVPVIRHCMNLTVEYCKEEIELGYSDNGEPITALGIARITDPVLLKEFIQYRQGSNVDRIVAFRHVLAFDKYLEKNHAVIRVNNEAKKEFKFPVVTAGPFSSVGGGMFSRNKSPFK